MLRNYEKCKNCISIFLFCQSNTTSEIEYYWLTSIIKLSQLFSVQVILDKKKKKVMKCYICSPAPYNRNTYLTLI